MPAETDQIELPSDWTDQERWVWEKLSRREIADFTTEEAEKNLDIRKTDSQEWSERTVLSPSFLRTILLDKPYRGAFPWSGVKIIGAWIKEPLCIEDVVLSHPWWMDRCRFEAEVLLINLRTPCSISLEGSTFEGLLNMFGSSLDGSLNMNGSIFTGHLTMNYLNVKQHLVMSGAQFGDVELIAAIVGGDVYMTGSTFTGALDMNRLEVKGSLVMNGKAKFVWVDLGSTKVGGQINMVGATFTGCLNMASLEVGQHLQMNGGAKFGDVDLTVAKVGGQMNMAGSSFTGCLDMKGLKVGGQLVLTASTFEKTLKMNDLEVTLSLFMNDKAKFVAVDLNYARVGGQLVLTGSTFKESLRMEGIHIGQNLSMRNIDGLREGQPVIMGYAEILGTLDISGSQLPSLNLIGTKIQGEFRLDPSPTWRTGAILTLRNTEVGALQDEQDAWPETLDLKDFTYTRLGGWNQEGETPVTNREVSWFCNWLEKQPCYSPQPYQQLANVLLKAGHRERADEILYAGRERERKSTHGWARVWMGLLNGTIGYGYKTWRSLEWAVLAVFVGMDVLILHGILCPHQIVVKGIPEEFAYSLDMLLPGVQLSKQHFDIVLDGWIKYYFYVHRLIGVVLGSFLIAGLSGLTKK